MTAEEIIIEGVAKTAGPFVVALGLAWYIINESKKQQASQQARIDADHARTQAALEEKEKKLDERTESYMAFMLETVRNSTKAIETSNQIAAACEKALHRVADVIERCPAAERRQEADSSRSRNRRVARQCAEP